MARDGYLRGVLADGTWPFRYRHGVRELLGVPDDNGVRIDFASAPPRGGFRYLRQPSAAPQPQEWLGGPNWVTQTEDLEALAAAPTGSFPINIPGVTERPPIPPRHENPRPLDSAPVDPRIGQALSTSSWLPESQAALEDPHDLGTGVAPLAVQPAGEPDPLRPASPTQPALGPASSTGAHHTASRSAAPSLSRALDTPQPTSASTSAPTATSLTARPSATPRRRTAASASSVTEIGPGEPAPPIPVVATEQRSVWAPDRSDDEAAAVLPVVDADRPRRQPPTQPPLGVSYLDAPHHKPVDAPPAIESPGTPPPARPRAVLVRASAPVPEPSAFWERRQLGHLLTRIMR